MYQWLLFCDYYNNIMLAIMWCKMGAKKQWNQCIHLVLNQCHMVHQTNVLPLCHCTCYDVSQKYRNWICENQFHECLIIGYFMKVGSQAKVMSENNSIVKVESWIWQCHIYFCQETKNLEHKWMILQIQHSKLNATKIDTESAIFAHVINELKQANGFLDTT